jgi:hypothetical protein
MLALTQSAGEPAMGTSNVRQTCAIGSLDHRVSPFVRLKELGVAESELAPPPEIDTHARARYN